MKANELRIGNDITMNRQIITVSFSTFLNVERFPERYEPITLTEEWLLKFGFERKGSFYRIKNSRFVEILIHDKGIEVCNNSIYLNHIKHVHQLQNLYFTLTNNELTIKL